MTMADNLPESKVVTTDLIQKAIELKEGQDNVSVKDFSVCSGSGKGENFICVILAVAATTQEADREKEHNLIVKTVSANPYLKYGVLQKHNIFYTEVMTYRALIPDMISYQKQRGMQPFGLNVPQYYHSIVDDDNGILILEDLHQDFYKLANRHVGLDHEHCKLVMKELGVFHALSWALKKRNPDNLKKYDYLSRDSLFEEEVPVFFSQALESAVNLVKLCTDSEEVRNRVGKLLKLDLYDEIKRLINPVEPYAVVCHGDPWCNNLMFKYNQKDGDITPTNVKLIDFQISRYAPPATDLAYFFYTNTTKDTREKHQTDLLRLYYSTFMGYLEALDVDFPEFTFDVLQQQFRETSFYGILSACFLLPTVLSKPEDAIRFDTKGTKEEFDDYTQEYNNRLTEISENNVIIRERLSAAIEDAIHLQLI